MKYNHAVKVNGVWYQPNTEVPEAKKANTKTTTTEEKNPKK